MQTFRQVSAVLLVSASFSHQTSSNNNPPRFKAPSVHLPWSVLSVLRPAPYGKCWILSFECRNDTALVGLLDDTNEAYRYLKVGENERACLSRAMFYWNMCGNGAHQPVLAQFVGTKTVASYPPEDVIEDIRARMFSLFTAYNFEYRHELQVRTWRRIGRGMDRIAARFSVRVLCHRICRRRTKKSMSHGLCRLRKCPGRRRWRFDRRIAEGNRPSISLFHVICNQITFLYLHCATKNDPTATIATSRPCQKRPSIPSMIGVLA